MLVTVVVTAFAQGKTVDFTTYDVVAKKGNVTFITKGDDWRMIVGSLKKPKQIFLLGYSKEQAANSFDRIIELGSNDRYTNKDRNISFCGFAMRVTVTGTGDSEKYLFVTDDSKVRFPLTRSDCFQIKDSIMAGEKTK